VARRFDRADNGRGGCHGARVLPQPCGDCSTHSVQPSVPRLDEGYQLSVLSRGSTEDGAGRRTPVETCMLCHKRIIITHPQIQRLRKYYDDREPIPWERVNSLSEFVFFNHQRHVRAGFDCGRCHGDIANMDRVKPVVNLNTMGFCVQCHRDEEYSHDCLICHR